MLLVLRQSYPQWARNPYAVIRTKSAGECRKRRYTSAGTTDSRPFVFDYITWLERQFRRVKTMAKTTATWANRWKSSVVLFDSATEIVAVSIRRFYRNTIYLDAWKIGAAEQRDGSVLHFYDFNRTDFKQRRLVALKRNTHRIHWKMVEAGNRTWTDRGFQMRSCNRT